MPMAATTAKTTTVRRSIPAREDDLGQTRNFVKNPSANNPITTIIIIFSKGTKNDITWSSSLARTANGDNKKRPNNQNERVAWEFIKYNFLALKSTRFVLLGALPPAPPR
jgi:hypothetical protein